MIATCNMLFLFQKAAVERMSWIRATAQWVGAGVNLFTFAMTGTCSSFSFAPIDAKNIFIAALDLILLKQCSIFIQPPGGSKNLWDLVAVIKGQDDSLLPQNYCKGIMHMKHMVRFKMVSYIFLLTSFSRSPTK